MKLKKQIVRRSIAGQPMLIPVGEMTGEYNGIFTLTLTGEMIIDGIEAGLEKDEIVKKIADEFEADENEVRTDVEEFLENLRNYGLIE